MIITSWIKCFQHHEINCLAIRTDQIQNIWNSVFWKLYFGARHLRLKLVVRFAGTHTLMPVNTPPPLAYPVWLKGTMIARFMGPIRGPSGADRTQVGPMLATWTLLYGEFLKHKSYLLCYPAFIHYAFLNYTTINTNTRHKYQRSVTYTCALCNMKSNISLGLISHIAVNYANLN